MDAARAMECSKGKEFEIETALREALANAIRHGCAHDPRRTSRCAWPATRRRGC